MPPPVLNARPGRSVGAVEKLDPGEIGAAWLPRPATAPVMVGRTERISQDLAGGNSGHDDHGTDCHILEDHRHALVAAILRHHLSLVAQIIEVICRRHGHEPIVSLAASNLKRNVVEMN
jgi:hypothetical protein